ncbi:TetR/AcrR family transcriptional regulator [Streptomyces sp. NPDC002499]
MSPRKRLDRDALVATALALADAEGLGAVSTRRVAKEHDASPMALYRHFRDKDQILDALAERLLDDVRQPAVETVASWDARLRDLLMALVAALRPHPAAAGLVVSRILASPSGLALVEQTLELLAAAGFDEESGAAAANYALCSAVTLVVTEPGRSHPRETSDHDETSRSTRARLEALPPGQYPRIIAAAAPLSSCSSQDVYYRQGVDLVLAGFLWRHAALQAASD